MNAHRAALTGLVLAGCILAGLLTGLVTVRGWSDISIGTSTDYLSIYRLVHWHYQAGH